MARMALLLFAWLSLDSAIQPLAVGIQFPALSGTFLSGKKAVLPAAAEGKVALLVLGFTYDSRFSVEAWANRFRRDFGRDPRVTFFEVPIIGGFGRLGRWFIDGGMRRGTPKELHENVVTVYGGADLWKHRVGFKDPDAAYVILIDRDGRVLWLHAGPLDETRFASLAVLVNEALKK